MSRRMASQIVPAVPLLNISTPTLIWQYHYLNNRQLTPKILGNFCSITGQYCIIFPLANLKSILETELITDFQSKLKVNFLHLFLNFSRILSYNSFLHIFSLTLAQIPNGKLPKNYDMCKSRLAFIVKLYSDMNVCGLL